MDRPCESEDSGAKFERSMQNFSSDALHGGSDSNGNSKGRDGVWKIHIQRMRNDVDGQYSRYPENSCLAEFLPIPGDIMITRTARHPYVASYLGPNPGGNITVFVDRNFFDRDQHAKEEIRHQMARFFEPQDMIIRFGRFLRGWEWEPQAHIELYTHRPGTGRDEKNLRWYVHSRLPNNIQLSPPDPYSEAVMVPNRVVPPHPAPTCFVPRTADIIVRQATNQSFFINTDLGQFQQGSDFQDGDIVLRLSIQKWQSNSTYRRFTVDLYAFERTAAYHRRQRGLRDVEGQAWNWVFRGRDVQLFGPPNVDRMGRDQVLDRNGIEPFVRRPIPHWGLAREVFAIPATTFPRPDPER